MNRRRASRQQLTRRLADLSPYLLRDIGLLDRPDLIGPWIRRR